MGQINSTRNEALEKANAEIEHYLGGDSGLKLNDPLWLNKTDVKPMSFDVHSDDWRIGQFGHHKLSNYKILINSESISKVGFF